MKKIVLLLTALISFSAFANQPLLTPKELESKLKDSNVRIIDIRDPKTYAQNHIPGSLNAPYGKWRGPKKIQVNYHP